MVARFAVGILLLATSLVQAQPWEEPMRVEVVAPAGPLKPNELEPLLVEVTLQCSALVAAIGPANPEDAIVTVSFAAPEEVVITGPERLALPASGCTSGALSVSVTSAFNVSVGRLAPGLVPRQVSVMARLESAASTLPPMRQANDEFVVVAAADFLSQVTVPTRQKSCSCNSLDYEVLVSNLGNVPIKYTFSLGSQPSLPWTADVPDPLLVDPGETRTAVFTVHPAGGDEAGAYTLLVESSHQSSAVQGDPMAVTVLARHQSLLDVPGPDVMPLGLLALALAAAIVRRRA